MGVLGCCSSSVDRERESMLLLRDEVMSSLKVDDVAAYSGDIGISSVILAMAVLQL